MDRIYTVYDSDIENFKKYHKEVNLYTERNKKKLIKNNYCYYTGIEFADVNRLNINPNDPLKRSVDHKISILRGFVENIDPEIIGSHINLVYCIRYCNTLKANMSVEDFAFYVKYIREELINEGYKHN